MKIFIKSIFFIFLKPKIINKIGFYINEEYIFDHYLNLLKKMDSGKFDIILNDKFKNDKYKNFLKKLEHYSWNVVFLNDIYLIHKYKILITHLHLGGNTIKTEHILLKIKIIFKKFFHKIKKDPVININGQYFQKKLGIYNIRFMYGVDVGASNFGDFNKLFDEFFCHGPRDANMVRSRFPGRIFEMGYPRYDDYYSICVNKKKILTKFSCDLNKPTIVWLSTTSEHFSSILTYHKYFEKLLFQFNIILRPHPLEIDPQYDRFNKEVYRIIKESRLILNTNSFQNMSELYAISDLMVCDYGGTIFSSIYMNKNIVLLNHEEALLDSNTKGSTSIEVRRYLPSIDKNDSRNLEKIIIKNLNSSDNLAQVRRARTIYFGDKEIGNCSNLVTERLNKLYNNI